MVLDNFTFLLLVLYAAGIGITIAGGFVVAIRRAWPPSSLPSSSSLKPAGIRVVETKPIGGRGSREPRLAKRLIYREGESPWKPVGVEERGG